eukprot:scaffold459_cov249-Pinguiococcus_pyrenoidosus.AAC.19
MEKPRRNLKYADACDWYRRASLPAKERTTSSSGHRPSATQSDEATSGRSRFTHLMKLSSAKVLPLRSCLRQSDTGGRDVAPPASFRAAERRVETSCRPLSTRRHSRSGAAIDACRGTRRCRRSTKDSLAKDGDPKSLSASISAASRRRCWYRLRRAATPFCISRRSAAVTRFVDALRISSGGTTLLRRCEADLPGV